MNKQAEEALKRANAYRFARAVLKRELKDRKVLLSDMLCSAIPPYIQSFAIGDLLDSLPRVGPGNARRILRKAENLSFPIRYERPTGELTITQRHRIASVLRERGL